MSKNKKSGNKKPSIGFIGQGFVGKAYADDFENRGFTTVRYSLEEPYRANKEKMIATKTTIVNSKGINISLSF